MKTLNGFTYFTFTLALIATTAPARATPILLVSGPVEVSEALSFEIIEPPVQSESETNFVDPANLPPVDTAAFENDVDQQFEQEKLGQIGISSGITDDRYKWPANIDFQISSAFSPTEQNTIASALQTLSGILANCRVIRRFTENPPGDHVFITKEQNGCFSAVGRRGRRQNLNLGPGCVHHHVVVHEMIHAIGFHHEQIRPDRDQYVNIFRSNIIPGTEHNFNKSPLFTRTFNVPYDYYSIMHYGERDFSSNGQRTIQAKQAGIVVGSRGVVTDSDRRKIRALYNCP